MTNLNLTANGKPQELILAYLQENASDVLAEKINNGTPIDKDGKDKRFCKWLISNKDELRNNRFYIAAVLRAYRLNKPLKKVQLYAETKMLLKHNYSQLSREFVRKDSERLIDYVIKQGTNISSYCDYYRACEYLCLDMAEEKNRFPHDFKRWHDIRIDELRTKRALEDAEKRKELYAKFASVAEKYLPLQKEDKNDFVVIIARSPQDLLREGEMLNHCVGRMNYDQKFVREESLIFFVRDKHSPDVPFVTLEYSLKNKRILQCYGERDSKPSDGVLEFVNKKWLPFANKQLKKIQAA